MLRPEELNQDDGRDTRGRFAPGNKAACGATTGFARRIGQYRRAIHAAVDEEALQEIFRAMVRKAQEGDVPAARLVVEYVVGKPIDVDLMERLEALEGILEVVAEANGRQR